MQKKSLLGAGDFTISFNTDLFELTSYSKGFEPDFFYINDKEKENGILKFSIISLEDIASEENLLYLEFSVKHVCTNQTTEIEINGNMLADSITNPIKLNFVNTSINVIGTNSFEWVIDWPENCVRNGIKHQECMVCGARRNENTVIPASGEHTPNIWIIEKEATCVQDGLKYQRCRDCWARINDTVIPATGEHKFDNNGVCTVCGQIGSLKGDINGDNNVDAADLALLKKVIAKLIPIDDPSVKNPNVDGVGTEPDAADLALLKKIIAKLV